MKSSRDRGVGAITGKIAARIVGEARRTCCGVLVEAIGGVGAAHIDMAGPGIAIVAARHTGDLAGRAVGVPQCQIVGRAGQVLHHLRQPRHRIRVKCTVTVILPPQFKEQQCERDEPSASDNG